MKGANGSQHMRGVRPLFPSRFEPPTGEREIKQGLQNQLVCFSFQQSLAKFTQNGCVKARVGELKTEHIFPVQSPTNGIGGLLIRKPFGKLHEANQQQTPWRFC